MTDKPSEIVEMYRAASRSAARLGQEFVLDETRLRHMFSREQIDAIFDEIENVEVMEREYRKRLRVLDAIPRGVSDDD